MKKISLILFSITLIFSCSTQEDFNVSQESTDLKDISNVAIFDYTDDGTIEITTDYIKNKWKKAIEVEGNLVVELVNFKIVQSFDDETGSNTYFLKAISKNRTIETGAFLNKDADGNYILGTKECSCSGCPNGCHLEVNGTRCTCSGCGQDTSKKCTKTERVIIQA